MGFGAPVCPTAAPQAGFGGGSRRPSCQVRLSKSGRKNRGIYIKTALDNTIKVKHGAQTGTYCTRPRQNIMRGAPKSCQGARWARARCSRAPAPRPGGLAGRIFTKTAWLAKKKVHGAATTDHPRPLSKKRVRVRVVYRK